VIINKEMLACSEMVEVIINKEDLKYIERNEAIIKKIGFCREVICGIL
jgi:hypothetical protein